MYINNINKRKNNKIYKKNILFPILIYNYI